MSLLGACVAANVIFTELIKWCSGGIVNQAKVIFSEQQDYEGVGL